MSVSPVRIALAPGADLAGFRRAARRLVADGVEPCAVSWECDGADDLFGAAPAAEGPPLMLPKGAGDLARHVVCHSDPKRYALLCALIWRLTQGESALLEIASDALTHRLRRMEKSVRRDLHKMHAFVRFRRIAAADGTSGERYVAWFEPDHWIVEATASFFVDRFRGMDWAILTPRGSLRWDGRALQIGPPAHRADAPAGDDFERSWLAYYESTFNPARVNPDLMRQHMAVKYWKNLPEAAAIPGLVRGAATRTQAMIASDPRGPIKRDPRRAVEAMADQAPTTLAALNRQIAEARPPAPLSPVAVLGEARSTPQSLWSANSLATRRIWPAARSWDRPVACSTRRWPKPASTDRRSTSPTRSSTSNSNARASGGCTRRRQPARSSTTAGGCIASWTWCGRASWWRWARPPRRRWPADRSPCFRRAVPATRSARGRAS
jgi:DNA polymerase